MPVARKNMIPVRTEPYWRSECGRAVVYVGDCRDVMASMGPDQFHAIVTDPPYGLEFMGREWDAPWKNNGKVDASTRRADEMGDPTKAKYLRHNVEYVRDSYKYQEWFLARAEAMLRVAKPGAHLLSFGGTRMWHRMACAAEDAGWEIRDTIMWVYGSGFPKGHDVSKAIDKVLGAERTEVLEEGRAMLAQGQFNLREVGAGGYGYKEEYDVMAPVTDAAKQWSGWGTTLKPSHEPIVVARKPMSGSVAQNTLDHGCGGVNVDGCRVDTTGIDVERFVATKTSAGSGIYQFNSGEAGSVSMGGDYIKTQKDGRWPANLIHDGSDEVVELFPTTSPTKPHDGDGKPLDTQQQGWGFKRMPSKLADNGGSAARFFYTAKADDGDRPHGKGATTHPTVKPLDLMRYLVRLVCARGGVVLDPFMGSGSTGCAAVEEGMWFVGIEQSQEYADLAVGRLKLALDMAPVAGRLVSGVAPRTGTAPPPKKVR